MVELLFAVLVLGIVAWVLMQFPIPAPFRAVVYGILALMLLVILFRAFGANVGPLLR